MVCLHTLNSDSHMFPVGDTCLVGLYLDLVDAAACRVAPARIGCLFVYITQFPIISFLSVHIFVHRASTFVSSLLVISKLPLFGVDTFLLAFIWITASSYSIGQLCSDLKAPSILLESVRLICLVCFISFYEKTLFGDDATASIVNTGVAALWALSMYTLPESRS